MSNLELRPIEIRVLRNASSNDSRQVPAAGATVSVAWEGATATQATTCTVSADATGPVGNIGRLAVGDLVSQNATANLLQVRAVANDGRSVTIRNVNASGSAIGLAVGDRLMWLSPMRCLWCEDGAVRGVVINQPRAISATQITEAGPHPPYVLIDQLALGLGENDGVVVISAGSARDTQDVAEYPLTYGPLADSVHLSDQFSVKVAIHTRADRDQFVTRTDEFATRPMCADEGRMMLERMPRGGGTQDVLVYYSGAHAPGWKLSNNVPIMSTSERNAHGGVWREGDLSINRDVPSIQVYYNDAWREVALVV